MIVSTYHPSITFHLHLFPFVSYTLLKGKTKTVSLPASYLVWATSPEAAFIKGRFVWVHWDVHELKALLEKKKDDKGFLRTAVEGMPNIHIQ